MENDGSNSEKHLQTLPQLQATGAEVVGSDGESVGDLGEVRDGDFTVTGRGLLKGDLYIPVRHVQEITADKVILNVPAEEAKDISNEKDTTQTDPHAQFSEDVATERGAWGMSRKKE